MIAFVLRGRATVVVMPFQIIKRSLASGFLVASTMSAGWSMPPGTPGDAARLRGNPLWAVPMRELSATRDRPIFSPSRRPASPPAVVQAPPQLPPPPPLKPKPDHPRLTILGT